MQNFNATLKGPQSLGIQAAFERLTEFFGFRPAGRSFSSEGACVAPQSRQLSRLHDCHDDTPLD